MISVNHKGNFNKIEKFISRAPAAKYLKILEKYANEGVVALSEATPFDSGETSKSWGYKIVRTKDGITIKWTNSNVVGGIPVAILIQYGHATSNGGYVQGLDYINPAIKPIFDKILENIWREVTSI